MAGYVVIDFETTGFSPRKHDRVVEVGVVDVTPGGDIEDQWGTLINPMRDVGATHIHGITAADVLDAPTFDQIAPRLLQAIAGRAIVAHNALFDLRFLEHELAQAGFPLPTEPPTLCTMRLSSQFVHGVSRKLVDCCAAAGIECESAHSAAADARATAGLLAFYLTNCGTPPPWADILTAADLFPWPCADATFGSPALVQRPGTTQREDAWLDQVTSKMPRVADPAVESYIDVLERALIDGYLSAHEKRDLVDLASTLGVPRDQLDKIHRVYLSALATAAWADGVVTSEEQLLLSDVATSLGVPLDDARTILDAAQSSPSSFELPTLHFAAGDRVVFTGELSRPREEWVARAAAVGIEHGSVTKGTRAVVAADPDSLSGKAAKARDYGIPIITEAAFEQVIRAMETRRDARARALAT